MIGWRLKLVLLSLVSLFVFALPARAQDETGLVAILTLRPQQAPIPVGTRPVIEADLINQVGRPIPNKVLILYVNGEKIRRTRTDAMGRASIRVGRDLPVGEHQIEVVFPGTEAYDGVSASQTVTIRPIRLTVETVPHISGARFTLNGETFTTDAEGLAVVEIMEPGIYDLEALDVSDVQVNEDTRVTFSRWADSQFQPKRTISVRRDVYLQAGFTTSHRVSMSFEDLYGNEVSPERITSITLKRSNGSYFTFENGEPRWLMATRVTRRKEGLEATLLLYSVESVVLDGTSAVNRYQQRFTVKPEDNWQIQLLLYTVRIHANDAIFGFRIGTGVALHYPDGRIEELEFGDNREVYLTSLARGLYHVRVNGVKGLIPLTPIALSKDQVIELKVLTALDIGVGGIAGVMVALGLLLVNRPHILAPLGKLRRRQVEPLTPARVHAQARETPLDQPVIPAGRVVEVISNPKNACVEHVGGQAVADFGPPIENLGLIRKQIPGLVSVSGWRVAGANNGAKVNRDPYAALLARFHPEGLKCPRCSSSKSHVSGRRRRSHLKVYRCSRCGRRYNLYSGTPFARSQLTPAQCERLLSEHAVDDITLARELELSAKTVQKWRLRLAAAGLLSEPHYTRQRSGHFADHSVREIVVRGIKFGVVLLLAFLWLATPATAVSKISPVPIFAYYYIWYDSASWDRAKTDFPLLGRYSSDDRTVMEEHIRTARAAGIDGFIVSWKSTYKLDQRLEQLMDVAASEDFSLLIIYQGLDFDRRPLPIDVILNDLEYFSDNYASHPAFSVYDLPVVILSGTWEFSTQDIQTIGNHLRGKLYLLGSERSVEGYLRIANAVDGNAYYWSSVDPMITPGYEEKLRAMGAAVHDHRGIWIAPAAPGFDARLIGGTRVVDRRNGQTLRDELNAALRSNPDAIGIISWNEFSENTHIEPSERYGTQAIDVLMGRQTTRLPRVTNFDSSAPGQGAPDLAFQPFILLGVLMLAVVSITVVLTRQQRL